MNVVSTSLVYKKQLQKIIYLSEMRYLLRQELRQLSPAPVPLMNLQLHSFAAKKQNHIQNHWVFSICLTLHSKYYEAEDNMQPASNSRAQACILFQDSTMDTNAYALMVRSHTKCVSNIWRNSMRECLCLNLYATYIAII